MMQESNVSFEIAQQHNLNNSEELAKARREWLNIHEDESFVNLQDYKKLYPNVFK